MRRKAKARLQAFLLLFSATLVTYVSWTSPDEDPPGSAEESRTVVVAEYRVGRLTVTPILLPKRDVCCGTDYLILVPSAANNFKRRKNVRRTWGSLVGPGSTLPRINYLIVLGQTEHGNVAARIAEEAEAHGDILVFDFSDNYLNLTTKVLSGYSWVADNCDSVSVIGKVDDDVILNVRRLENYFAEKNVSAEENFVLGPKNGGLNVVRDPESKWYVSETEYPFEAYPQYAAGFVYFVSRAYAEAVVESVEGDQPLGIDDAYLTGIKAVELNATRVFDDLKGGTFYGIGCHVAEAFVRQVSNSSSPAHADPVGNFPVGVECSRTNTQRTIHKLLTGQQLQPGETIKLLLPHWLWTFLSLGSPRKRYRYVVIGNGAIELK